ncbi:MAG: methyltransferase [Polyangiaceae bacterium]|nr:methyltransferase [Myxococcales bacterium]MCB9589669.1 methyltransferase [Polyangiaceae bacterium]
MAKRKARLGNLANRDPVIAGVAIEHLIGEVDAGEGAVLVVDDDTDLVAEALTAEGVELRRWNRRALDGRRALPWPEAGEVAAAVVRLGRDWPSFDFALHAVASRIKTGGKLWVYGANDEGIRSAPRRIAEAFFTEPETVHLKRRARVLECVRNDVNEGLKLSFDDFRTSSDVTLPLGGSSFNVSLASYPGAFARGRLDSGTEILLRGLEELKPRKQVLDFCAGVGVVGVWAKRRWPEAELSLLEVDAPSLEAAKQNLPDAKSYLSDAWKNLPKSERYDAIVSNPPIHRGTEEDMGVLHELVQGAAAHLTVSGVLVCVVQKSVGAGTLFNDTFKNSRVLLETNAFQVWCGSKR